MKRSTCPNGGSVLVLVFASVVGHGQRFSRVFPLRDFASGIFSMADFQSALERAKSIAAKIGSGAKRPAEGPPAQAPAASRMRMNPNLAPVGGGSLVLACELVLLIK